MVIHKYICNRCGEEYRDDDYDKNGDFNFAFGYESCHDGERVSFNLCGRCLDTVLETMIREFKICPSGWYDEFGYYFTKEEKEASFIEWKQTGYWNALCGCSYERLVELAEVLSVDYINYEIGKRYPEKGILNIVK